MRKHAITAMLTKIWEARVTTRVLTAKRNYNKLRVSHFP